MNKVFQHLEELAKVRAPQIVVHTHSEINGPTKVHPHTLTQMGIDNPANDILVNLKSNESSNYCQVSHNPYGKLLDEAMQY